MKSNEDSVMHFGAYLLDLNLHSQQLLVLKMPLVELPLLIVQAIEKQDIRYFRKNNMTWGQKHH